MKLTLFSLSLTSVRSLSIYFQYLFDTGVETAPSELLSFIVYSDSLAVLDFLTFIKCLCDDMSPVLRDHA
jgi:hypothetical protein